MTVRSDAADSAAVSPLARHPVAAFFVLTLALSWALWIPMALDLVSVPAVPFIVVGGFGPMAAAAIVTVLTGWSLRAWLAPVLRWRVRPRWYLVALGYPVASRAVETAGYVLSGGTLSFSRYPLRVATYLVNLPFVALLGGGQEEFGWRGFALPRLQARYSGLVASLAIGVVWAAWHLPLFWVPGSSQAGLPLAPFLASVPAISVVFTWLYNRTGGSLLLAVLLHASVNASSALYPIAPEVIEGGIPRALAVALAAVPWAVAVALVAWEGPDLAASDATRGAPTADRESGVADG